MPSSKNSLNLCANPRAKIDERKTNRWKSVKNFEHLLLCHRCNKANFHAFSLVVSHPCPLPIQPKRKQTIDTKNKQKKIWKFNTVSALETGFFAKASPSVWLFSASPPPLLLFIFSTESTLNWYVVVYEMTACLFATLSTLFLARRFPSDLKILNNKRRRKKKQRAAKRERNGSKMCVNQHFLNWCNVGRTLNVGCAWRNDSRVLTHLRIAYGQSTEPHTLPFFFLAEFEKKTTMNHTYKAPHRHTHTAEREREYIAIDEIYLYLWLGIFIKHTKYMHASMELKTHRQASSQLSSLSLSLTPALSGALFRRCRHHHPLIVSAKAI